MIAILLTFRTRIKVVRGGWRPTSPFKRISKTSKNAGKRLKMCIYKPGYCLGSTLEFPTFTIFRHLYKTNRSHADINNLT